MGLIPHKSMDKQMVSSVLKRFLKGFLAGGVSSVILILNTGVSISSISDLKQFAVSLGVAFFTGGLMALEKGLRWR